MKNVTMDGIIVTKSTNFANSCPPQARSRYLPPNQTTRDEMSSETTLFSISALVRNVQGNLIDFVGIKTRYGTAHCGEVSIIEGAVLDCSFAGVAVDQEWKRMAALMADRARRVSKRARVSGGRLIRGGMLYFIALVAAYIKDYIYYCFPRVKLERYGLARAQTRMP